MKYKITIATDEDLVLMQRFFYQTVTIYGSLIFTKEEIVRYSKLAANKRYWKQKFANDFVYNAKLNGEIIGSFLLNRDGAIGYIFVHQDYQRKGIAMELYKTLEEVAIDSGIHVLQAEINMATKTFFEKNGFTVFKNGEPSKKEEIIRYKGIKNISKV